MTICSAEQPSGRVLAIFLRTEAFVPFMLFVTAGYVGKCLFHASRGTCTGFQHENNSFFVSPVSYMGPTLPCLKDFARSSSKEVQSLYTRIETFSEIQETKEPVEQSGVQLALTWHGSETSA